MKPEQILVIGLGLTFVALVVAWEAKSSVKGFPNINRIEITPESLLIGKSNPTLWIFYNDSEINTRHWLDFGARTSKAINIPLLNILYERIVRHNGQDYRVEVLGGLAGVAQKFGGWEALPPNMRSTKARVSVAEEDWIRTAILAKFGGLWVSGSIISLKPFGKLPKDSIVAFGQDDVPMYGSKVPGFRAMWVPKPNHPMMVEWETRIRSRLDVQLGGKQFRGDAKSDWTALTALTALTAGTSVIEIRSVNELGRNPLTNKKLELEDIFASGTEGRIPFEIPATATYIVLPYQDLLDRRSLGWVLRMSEKQFMESDLAITHILRTP